MAVSKRVRVVALILDVVATILVTIVILTVHRRIKDSGDGTAVVEVSNGENIERGMLVLSLGMYGASFVLLLVSEFA